MINEITFEQLPQAVASIIDELHELKAIVTSSIEKDSSAEVWFTIKELREYLPSNPSDSSIRRWIKRGLFPVYKDGDTRIIRFKKSDIDAWLESTRQMSISEQRALQDEQILARRHAKKGACYD